MNIDAYPADRPASWAIQSIPPWSPSISGQMVDGFLGALPESEIKAFIDRCVGPAGEDLEALFGEAQALLEAGDFDVGRSRLHARAGDLIPTMPARSRAWPAFSSRAARSTRPRRSRRHSRQTGPCPRGRGGARRAGAAGAGRRRSAISPFCWRASKTPRPTIRRAMIWRWRSTRPAGARRRRRNCSTIVKRDRAWNDEAARKLLLQLFESWGPLDPATRDGPQAIVVRCLFGMTGIRSWR